MAVDQQPVPEVRISTESRNVNFTNECWWQCMDVVDGVNAAVVCADIDIADIEQKPATGSLCDFHEERRFIHFAHEIEVVRRVLQQDRSANTLLEMFDPGAQSRKGLTRSWQGQEVCKVTIRQGGPDGMLGNSSRIQQVDQPTQGAEVFGWRETGTTQRRADTVQTDGIVRRYLDQTVESRSTRHHVVFGMDLEPKARFTGAGCGKMRRFEADTGVTRQKVHDYIMSSFMSLFFIESFLDPSCIMPPLCMSFMRSNAMVFAMPFGVLTY